jgi:hypothetical protein
MAEPKAVRCAIYTRKSTEFGLEQDLSPRPMRAGSFCRRSTTMVASQAPR